MRPQAGVGKLKHAPPMQANDLPVGAPDGQCSLFLDGPGTPWWATTESILLTTSRASDISRTTSQRAAMGSRISARRQFHLIFNALFQDAADDGRGLFRCARAQHQ